MDASLRHLRQLGYNPAVIVDVGSASGTEELLTVFPESRFVWIEPLLEFEEHLEQLSQRYNGKYLIAACGKQTGNAILNVHPNLTASSLLQEADGTAADGIPRRVKMYSLDDLINTSDIQGSVLLKIDVQGMELEVLEGAQQMLSACEAIILEVSFFRFLKTNPEIADVIGYMKEKEFVPYDVFGGSNRPFDGALAQKDILFVKEKGYFRNTHRWATKEQRESYVDNYGKRNMLIKNEIGKA